MVFSIEEFSSHLCLVYSTDLCVYDSELKDESKLVPFILMMKLREMYGQEIQSAVDKIFSNGEISFFHSFLKAILSRCVELSKNATYLHFMLTATFVKQVVTANFCSTKCFTLPKIASLALIAAYNRCYKGCFSRGNESRTLESYCSILNSVLVTEESITRRRNLSPFVELDIGTLMASLKDVDDINFELTADEETGFIDIFVRACSKELIEDGTVYKKSSESELFSEETDSEDTTEYSPTNNKLHLQNLCELCGFDCTEYIVNFCMTTESKTEKK